MPFQRHRLPDSARLMLFMSRVHPQKGLPLLLEALSRLGRQLAGWQLVIAGPDEAGHVAELKRLAARLGVASVVHFVGPVYGQDKRDALAAADLFVLPSYSESLAIVVAEALAMCVPVLTTRGAPWDELLEHRCGWWTETTVAGIQAGLSDAIHRPAAELAAMGQRGAALVAGRYTWAVVAEKSLQLYAWLLNQAPRPEFVWLE
jgi:glycosyltransferase involved in cell wall biosynthesis